MNKILFLSDFSDNARNAVYYGMKAFPPSNHSYVLLNCYDRIYTPTDVIISLSERMQMEAQEALAKEELEIGKHTGSAVSFDKVSYLGFLSDGVNHVAAQKKPDLVIMGTKGKNGLPTILMGSRASSLVKAINLPLLIVPEKAKYGGLKNIVLAADVSTLNKPHHLEPLSQFARIFNSKLSVVHVGKEDVSVHQNGSDEAKRLRDIFGEVEFHAVKDKDTAHGIALFAHERPCDMVVVVERTRSFVVDLFHKSVSKNLALHSDIPLLVLHD